MFFVETPVRVSYGYESGGYLCYIKIPEDRIVLGSFKRIGLHIMPRNIYTKAKSPKTVKSLGFKSIRDNEIISLRTGERDERL